MALKHTVHELTIHDPWKEIRLNYWGNVEPEVKLEAMTLPIGDNMHVSHPLSFEEAEALPAFAASTSYGSRGKLEKDMSRAISLNKLLIQKRHLTPLEAVQFNFRVTGISKACGAQLSRYRTGQGHVSASRRYRLQEPTFIYPILDYISDKGEVIQRLNKIEALYKSSYETYEWLRKEEITLDIPKENSGYKLTYEKDVNPLHKEDARLIVPVATATERSWWRNARALRYLFNERITQTAEWEIRRLCIMIFNLVIKLTPSLFSDMQFVL